MQRRRLWALDHQERLREIPDIGVELLTFGLSGFLGLYAGHTRPLSYYQLMKAHAFADQGLQALARRGFAYFNARHGLWVSAQYAQSLVTDRGHPISAQQVLAELAQPFATKKAMQVLLPRQEGTPGKHWQYRRRRTKGLVESTRRAQAAYEAGDSAGMPPPLRAKQRNGLATSLDPDYFGCRVTGRSWKQQRKVRKQWMRTPDKK